MTQGSQFMLILDDSIYLMIVFALFLFRYSRTLLLWVVKFFELMAC